MDVSKLYDKAEEAIKRKNYDYAIDILAKQILPIYPNDVKARKLLRGTVIRKYDEKGYPGKLAKMKKAGPMTMAKSYEVQKNWDKALEEIEKALALDPKDVGLLYMLGYCAKEGGHLETAISTLENAVQIDSTHAKSLKLLGYLFWQTDELDKAQSYFLQASRIDPTDNEAKKAVKDLAAQKTSADYGKAKSSKDLIKDQDGAKKLEKKEKILRTEEDIREAIEYAMQDYEADKGSKKALRELGDLYSRLEEYEKAVEWYEKALAVDPNSFDIKIAVGDAKIGMFDREAKALARAYKASKSEEDKARYKASKRKMIDFQVEEYSNRVAAQPTDLDLRFQLGAALFDQGNYDASIAEFQKSCKHPQRKLESFNYMGQGFLKQNDPDLAISQFTKALEGIKGMRNDKVKAIHYNLGKAYAAADRAEEALAEFQAIMEADISYKDVRQRVKELKGQKA